MTTSATFPSTATDSGIDLGRSLDELAWAIERDGIERHEQAVARLVSRLRAAGATGSLLDLVAAPDEPAVARERAFGRLSDHATAGTTGDRRLAAA